MRVIVTGGGTGGHIYPAMAIAKGLLDKVNNMQVLYIGTRNGMEAKIVPENGLDFRGISGRGLPRKVSIETFKAAGTTLRAFGETKNIMKQFKPDLVVGTGGYVSGPVVFTAAFFGVPTLLHEQNALPGITNKLLSKMVKRVLVTFPESEKYFGVKEKLTVVGLPVREEIGTITRKEGAHAFGLDSAKRTILVTGGSRGALSLNNAMLDILPVLAEHPEIQLIWATGAGNYESVVTVMEDRGLNRQTESWRIMPYINTIPHALAGADLCVCRSGASTLAELSAAGRASILIPYPYAAENHQEYNARAFENHQASYVILDKELSGPVLWNTIQNIIFDPIKTESMEARAKEIFKPGALDRIVTLCLETAWR
ncbi:undecaprenyldiphospho-muramoylpentapeptide beta-N-acetylglucosaminyltransferase [Dehalobacter sp. DCM]|uniref:undecaprenyldiphospho-muramoylpentapeptide beta-N-acetylglucosaminyltransferase n=1 Tax=Dehalobacter sp. DCM TaxID=2907827 RepID=UPI0030814FEA|nr:undecaprenyldiphospho-muramoylpentapeptide beta-N-acetylglucosaminyltransferase [Dehalobacter sp. DCM]